MPKKSSRDYNPVGSGGRRRGRRENASAREPVAVHDERRATSTIRGDELSSLSVSPSQHLELHALRSRSPLRSSWGELRDGKGGAGQEGRNVRTGTILSLSGLGSTAADFVTKMERLTHKELAGLWRRLEEGMHSEASLAAALKGPKTHWNPYRPARGSVNLRQEVLNSELAEFSTVIVTDALCLQGRRIARGPAEAPHEATTRTQRLSAASAGDEKEEVFVAHGHANLSQRAAANRQATNRDFPKKGPKSTAITTTPAATTQALTEALFSHLWREVATPIVAKALLDLSLRQQPISEDVVVMHLSNTDSFDAIPPPRLVASSGEWAHRGSWNEGVATTPLSFQFSRTGGAEDSVCVPRRCQRHSSAPNSRDESVGSGLHMFSHGVADESKPKLSRRPTTCDDGRPPSHPLPAELTLLPLDQLQERMHLHKSRRQKHRKSRMVLSSRSVSTLGAEADDTDADVNVDDAVVVEDVQGGTSLAASPKRKLSSLQVTGRQHGTNSPSSAARARYGGDLPPALHCERVPLCGLDAGEQQPPFAGDYAESVDDDGSTLEERPGTTTLVLSPHARMTLDGDSGGRSKGGKTAVRRTQHAFPRYATDNSLPPRMPARDPTPLHQYPTALTLSNRDPPSASRRVREGAALGGESVSHPRSKPSSSLENGNSSRGPRRRANPMASAGTASLTSDSLVNIRTPLHSGQMQKRFAPLGPSPTALGDLAPHNAETSFSSTSRSCAPTGSTTSRIKGKTSTKALQGARLAPNVSPILRVQTSSRKPSPQSLGARGTTAEAAAVYLSPDRRSTSARRHNSPLPLPRAPDRQSMLQQDAAAAAEKALATSVANDNTGGSGSNPALGRSAHAGSVVTLPQQRRSGRATGAATSRQEVRDETALESTPEKHTGTLVGNQADTRSHSGKREQGSAKTKKRRPTTAFM